MLWWWLLWRGFERAAEGRQSRRERRLFRVVLMLTAAFAFVAFAVLLVTLVNDGHPFLAAGLFWLAAWWWNARVLNRAPRSPGC